MSSYTVTLGNESIGTVTDAEEAAAMLTEAREMSRTWASYYRQPIGLTVDGLAIDTTNLAELDRVGVGD